MSDLNTSSDFNDVYLLNLVIDQLREGMMITDAQGHIIKINHAFSEITGYQMTDVVNQTPKILRSGVHLEDFYQKLWQELDSLGYWDGEIWNKRKNGVIYPEWLQISKVVDKLTGKIFYVGIFSDISERKASQKRIENLALYDSLTGLANRVLFTQFLESSLAKSNNARECEIAVLFIDLDKFKSINDHFGHAVGDWVLQEAAQRITSHIRESDLACRFGGDEFVVVLQGVSQLEKIQIIAEKLIRNLSQVYLHGDQVHYLTASVGIALYPQHGEYADTLIRRADIAMYRAKSLGRNRVQFFDHENEDDLLKADITSRLILQAIDNPNEFIEMHYQPIYSQKSFNNIVEYEALIRLINEHGELVYPNDFIEYAEQNNLIEQLGLALFKKVCDDVKNQQLAENTKVGINLSALQLNRPDLVENLCEIAHQKQMSIDRFNFEVTETSVMTMLNEAICTLTKLKQKGCNILLDDFGTGYASLSILKKLPVDVIKIDQSFISEIEVSQKTREMLIAMIAMGKALNLEVLAEGVETEVQKQWLQANGVDFFQGYLLGKSTKIIN